MKRYEVSDAQSALIADLMPANGRRGGQWNDHRLTLNAILWVLHTGAQWRELPERYGAWKTAHARLTRWRADGTLARILGRLHLRLDAAGLIDHDLWCVDATSVRAGRSAAGGKNRHGRAGRPRPGPQPRRVLDQAALGRRRRRGAAGGAGDGRPGPRVGPP